MAASSSYFRDSLASLSWRLEESCAAASQMKQAEGKEYMEMPKQGNVSKDLCEDGSQCIQGTCSQNVSLSLSRAHVGLSRLWNKRGVEEDCGINITEDSSPQFLNPRALTELSVWFVPNWKVFSSSSLQNWILGIQVCMHRYYLKYLHTLLTYQKLSYLTKSCVIIVLQPPVEGC